MNKVLSKRARFNTNTRKWSIVAVEANREAIEKVTINGYETNMMSLDSLTFKKVMKQYSTLKCVFEEEKNFKIAFWIREIAQ